MDQLQEIKDRAFKQGQWQAYYELSNAIDGLRHNRECYNIMMQFLVVKMGTLAGNSASSISKQLGQYQNNYRRLSEREMESLRQCHIQYVRDNPNGDNS